MGPVLSTTVALLSVCALAMAMLRLLGRRGPSLRGLRVVARLPLDARRTLYVVEAGGRCLLLGGGDGALTLLTELERGSVPAMEPVAPLEALKRAIGLP